MRKRPSLCLLCGAGVVGFVTAFLSAADDLPKAAEPGTLLVIDPAGKEQKLKGWTYVAGTRHLAFLAPADKEPDPPKDKSPKD